MKWITRLSIVVVWTACLAQAALAIGTVLGGNLPALRPTYTPADEANFDLALSYLRPGDTARVPSIEWEIAWGPKSIYNYRGVDAAIHKMASKGITPIWLLTPCPAPNSPWYPMVWPDWWLPSRSIWTSVVSMNSTVVQHIVAETSKSNGSAPLFQLWNEPQGGKPGGSITSKFGEWAPSLHELLYRMVMDMRSKGIPKSQIVGPAVSSFGESGRTQAAEFASMMPPPNFDWLSECGYRDCHLRLSAAGSRGDVTKVQAGFKASLDWYLWLDSRYTWPVGQQTIVSELYVTPGDCEVPIGTDMYPYHAIALNLLKASNFRYAALWGLRPGEADDPTNPWLVYGGFGDSLVKWRAGS